MASSPTSNVTSYVMTTGDTSRDLTLAKPPRDQRPLYVEANSHPLHHQQPQPPHHSGLQPSPLHHSGQQLQPPHHSSLQPQQPHHSGLQPSPLHHSGQQPQPPHQPMYRKREAKPGQKDKRVLKKTSDSPSSRKKHGTKSKDQNGLSKKNNTKSNNSNPASKKDSSKSKTSIPAPKKESPKSKDPNPAAKKENPKSKNSIPAPKKDIPKSKDANPAPKKDSRKPDSTNQNSNIPKKKTKRQNNKTNKKTSKLAFWFCMSSNTDAQDRSSQAPVSKLPQPKPSIEHTQDTLDREAILEVPTEILATKYSKRHAGKRHSAPTSSEWTRIVTMATVESASQRPRSRTPTGGVRYRYDGTLERPYVYPGGLTFQSFGDKSWRQEARRSDDRSSSSFCDTITEDVPQFAAHGKHDDADIASRFYLRFDDNHVNGSRSNDRPMSTPPDFVEGQDRQLGQKPRSPALETIPHHSFPGSGHHDDNYSQDQSVIYDIPYESDSDKEGENEIEDEQAEGKRNSYYSKPLQNSGCIYMWHSCEDLQHCEERYHSKDRICLNCKGNTPPRCHQDVHTGYGSGGDHISVSSSPTASAGPAANVISGPMTISLPVGLTLEYPSSYSAPQVTSLSDQTTETITVDVTPRNSHGVGEIDANEAMAVNGSSNSSQYVTSVEEANPKLPDQSEQSDIPFRRDLSRSSCMPGNKRFFLPPPPCYTPPKEEMEVALTSISKVSCHRGSQTDLTEDVDQVNMEDRDLSLQRLDTQRQHAMMTRMASVSLDTETSVPVATEKRTVKAKRELFEFQKGKSNSDVTHELSNNTQENLTKSDPNQNTKPSPTVRTSTPKPTRRSGQQGDDLKVFSGPKPLPRKRITSKDSTSSSFSTSQSEALQQPTEIESGNQAVDSIPNTVIVRTTKITPVPKKRRSQMVEADLTYTFADIEKVLAECKDSLPRGVQPLQETSITKDGRQCSQNFQVTAETQTSPLNANGIGSGRLKAFPVQTQATPSKDQNHVTTSPEHRGRLNSSLGSSIDGGYTSSRMFAALSPSLDNMAHIFQAGAFDPDNEDNCNADDEMSIHNEDILPSGTAAVQNLLRSRSIFDRSLAVTRKRRQRLRDRKCHSQLLSSADIDDYDTKMTRGHLWKLQKCGDHERPSLPVFHSPNCGKHFLKPQLLTGRNFWKHSYTDSGNDSDMVSPIDTRDHRHAEDVFQGSYPSPEVWKRAGNCDCVQDTPDKKSWEIRLKAKHELRKARSIEHLFLAQEARTTKKQSLETCV